MNKAETESVNAVTPEKVRKEYEEARSFKASFGSIGLYEQSKKNERFMLGDHWNGVDMGDIPKVVINVIKQIGDFKVSNIVSNPCTAIFDFEGVPTHLEAQANPNADELLNTMKAVNLQGTPSAEIAEPISFEQEHNAVSAALTSHFRSAWERCKMDKKNQTGVRKAYMHGTYVLYSYFNPDLNTGLYADEARKTAVKGDIETEVLDIANVYFGDSTECDVQKQPWIIITQRKALNSIKSEMVKNGKSEAETEEIKADEDNQDVGNHNNTTQNQSVTLFTRFWRGENGNVWAMQCTEKIVVKDEWDTGVEQYPFAVFCWDELDNCIYGHSEITELIPNQVAINRMVALEILSEMSMGMPKIIYDETAISVEITNDPGQIIPVENSGDVQGALRYVNPAQISPNWNRVQQNLIDNTKSVSGATSVALGDVRPENTSAIIALREASALPLQPILNRYYYFIEDIARIWGEIMLKKYGKRSLRVVTSGKVTYIPFDADKYKDMMLSARIEVGPSTLWATSTVISTLDNLLSRNAIDVIQFLERIPEGYITKKQELINELKAQREAQLQAQQASELPSQMEAMPQGRATNIDIDALLEKLTPETMSALQENPEMIQNLL